MKFIKAFFGFWYDFIVGDCWEIAAGVTILVSVAAIAISRGWIALQETAVVAENGTLARELHHPVFPLLLAAALMLLLMLSVYLEFRRKLEDTRNS